MDKVMYSGAQILLKSLQQEGVEEVFGYPGGVVLPLYDALYLQDDIKHYLVRHEQAAIHAAEGYARVSGKAGVAIVTSGPGACNTITGLANAYYDGTPLILITGQVNSKLIGQDAFQEADIVGITRSCCKHNYLVKDVRDLARVIKEAFYIATTGKKGPVVVDIPVDVFNAKCNFVYPKNVELVGYNPTYKGHPLQIQRALKTLFEAKRPVIISGGGVVASNASRELKELATRLSIPVVHTLMGAGTYPDNLETSLGMMGMHGSYCANLTVANSDCIFAIGTRFSDRITGCLKRFARDAQVIHIDIDPCSISKNVKASIPIVGDIHYVLTEMLKYLEKSGHKINEEQKNKWFNEIQEWKNKSVITEKKSEKLSALTVLKTIHEYTKNDEPIVSTEVGQHQMWTAQNFKFNEPRKLITSGGLGTMGFGFPAAMGAAVAKKGSYILNIAGDGSIQMNIQELMTCVDYKFKVINCIINNGYLGMVRQWQEKIYDKHYSQTKISSPDFVKLAQSYGALGLRVEKEEDIIPALQQAIEYDGPVMIDFVCENCEMVYPWVLAGKPIDNVLLSGEDLK
ncbi:MAG: biosynthetic-type acetolactate synthase large subunit [Candidatus Gastranaerophilales bacterium]|nr:biosynthetic-type acetolactate synthase large subunit [Candidatus Gastranaerophilales bacterium]